MADQPAHGRGRAAVASGHPGTTAAAREILQAGGNAFDAMVAAVFTACVTEPMLCSLGGGGVLLACPDSTEPLILDCFVQTPRQRRDSGPVDFEPITGDFGEDQQVFHVGAGSVATPGLLAGLETIHQRFGSLSWQAVIQPATRTARAGVSLNALQAYTLAILEPIVRRDTAAAALFRNGGQLLREGDHYAMPAYADALDQIARVGAAWLYQGSGAQALLADIHRRGGHLGPDDLTHYRPLWRDPLQWRFGRSRLSSNPPPAFGGLLLNTGCRSLLQQRQSEEWDMNRADERSLCIARALTDADTTRQALAETDSEILLEQLQAGHLNGRGTTHISIADDRGNLAAMSVSNGEGAGVMLTDSQIMLNNMLGEEDIQPRGIGQWLPDQRVGSMMAPTLLESEGARFVVGTGGSNRIRSALLQVLSHLLMDGHDLKRAIEAPRMHVEGGRLSLEPGVASSSELENLFADVHHWQAQNLFFGGVHAVGIAADGSVQAAADHRRGGSVWLDQG